MFLLSFNFFDSVRRYEQIHRWDHKQSKKSSNGQASKNNNAHGLAACRTSSRGDHQGDDSKHHGCSGHENWTKSNGCCLFNRLSFALPLSLQLFGDFYNQYAMLTDQAHQGDQAYLGINVDRCHS